MAKLKAFVAPASQRWIVSYWNTKGLGALVGEEVFEHPDPAVEIREIGDQPYMDFGPCSKEHALEAKLYEAQLQYKDLAERHEALLAQIGHLFRAYVDKSTQDA